MLNINIKNTLRIKPIVLFLIIMLNFGCQGDSPSPNPKTKINKAPLVVTNSKNIENDTRNINLESLQKQILFQSLLKKLGKVILLELRKKRDYIKNFR